MNRPPLSRLCRRIAPILTLPLALAFLACGGGGGGSSAPASPSPTAPSLTTLSLSPSGPTLSVGGSVDLQATGTFSDGSTVVPYDSQVTWTSSAPTTAAVSASGLVSAHAAGTATITATKGSVQASATVTVNATQLILNSITLSPAAGATLNVSQTADFTATAHWSNGTSTTPYDSSVAWTTNLPGVATVNAAGVVTAVSPGSATLTASAQGLNATAALTVSATSPTLSSITLNPTSATLNVGQTLDISATGHLSNGSTDSPYDSRVAWASSNPSVATVDWVGIVTAQAAGTTTITASASGKSATANITVTSSAVLTSISLTPATATLAVGGTVDLTATGNFSNNTSTSPYDSQVTWTSSNTGVATVNAGGLVTAVAGGSATIRATGAGGVYGQATITVTAPAFDAALVGRWEWIGTPNPVDFSNYGSFYTFNSNGTFTYSLIYQGGTGCIAYSKIVAYHEGTFSSTTGQIILTCSTLYDDYTNCAGSTQRFVKGTPATQIHEASLQGGLLYTRNDTNDFTATGWLGHTKK